MAIDDAETVALTAGGHTAGKAHCNGDANLRGSGTGRCRYRRAGLGWNNTAPRGMGRDTMSSGIEGAWTTNPTQFKAI